MNEGKEKTKERCIQEQTEVFSASQHTRLLVFYSISLTISYLFIPKFTE
jgi:hypothetical protein